LNASLLFYLNARHTVHLTYRLAVSINQAYTEAQKRPEKEAQQTEVADAQGMA